jgi:Tissue inhibitor of metalloproteinase
VRRIASFAFVVVSVVLMPARPAAACSCAGTGPACQSFWKAEAVFDATVVAIEPTTREVPGRSFPMEEYVVKLNVHQAWRDGQPGAIEVVTDRQESACGYSFKLGRRYVIFPWKRPFDGRWGVSMCSLTREYQAAGETVEFLASLASPPRGGRVYGSVTLNERVFDTGQPIRSRPVETQVRVSGGGQQRSLASTNGRFEFRDLAPGHYRVELQLPDGYTTYGEGRDVHIPNGYACAREDYYLAPATRLTGRVVGRDGRPPARLAVEAPATDARPHPVFGPATETAHTDLDGYFEIRGLPTGTYLVGINLRDLPNQYNPYARTFYPSDGSEALELPLSLGQTLDLGTWRLPPPLALVRILGVVTWQDGTPATSVFVGAVDHTGNAPALARGAGGATSGADGRFAIDLREGRVYTFIARDSRNSPLPISAPRIETNGVVDPIRIVIQRDPRR